MPETFKKEINSNLVEFTVEWGFVQVLGFERVRHYDENWKVIRYENNITNKEINR